MSMRLFDTHVHLDDERFAPDLPLVLERMKEAGVSLCVTVGADMPSSRAAQLLAQEHDMLYFSAGVHPHEAQHFQPSDLSELQQMLTHPKAVALGEIGLDYFYDHSPRDVQRSVFEQQLALAYTIDKPVILHVREAHGDMLSIVKNHVHCLPHCLVHCYSGSWESAQAYLDLGCSLALGGAVTFKNANKLLDVARNVPLPLLMIETDCPYLSPEPHRGKRNEPSHVAYVAKRIAELRGVDLDAFCEAVYANAISFFRIQTKVGG